MTMDECPRCYAAIEDGKVKETDSCADRDGWSPLSDHLPCFFSDKGSSDTEVDPPETVEWCSRCMAEVTDGEVTTGVCGKAENWEGSTHSPCAVDTYRESKPTADVEDESGENPKDRLGLQKLPLRLIPPPALAYLAMVMKQGADKYGPYNWREKKVRSTVYVEAAMRHLQAYLDGEDCDPAPPHMPHPAHAMACCAILLDAMATGNLVDDRPPPGRFAQLAEELTQKKEP